MSTTPRSHRHRTPPAWARDGSPSTAYLRGLQVLFQTPGILLVLNSIGFGALTKDLGLGPEFGVWTSVVLYALPAQLVLADQLGRGAPILASAFAVTLTAVRLLPMTVSLSPFLKDVKGRRWREVLAVHFVASTAWVEGQQRLGPLPPALRLPHFFGFGTALMIATGVGAAVGYVLSGLVPTVVGAALLFSLPIYMMLTMVAGARLAVDKLAIGLGVVIGPAVYSQAPQFDLVVAGLVGGTMAYVAGRGR